MFCLFLLKERHTLFSFLESSFLLKGAGILGLFQSEQLMQSSSYNLFEIHGSASLEESKSLVVLNASQIFIQVLDVVKFIILLY